MARSLVSEAHILGAFAASAVAGSLASAFLRSGGTSVGASGAILGLGGLMLGLALAHRELRPTGLISNLMRWIALLVLIGVAGMNFIDNAAHAGGLAMGVAIGLFIARDSGRPLPVEWRVKRAGWVVVAVLAGAPWLWMLLRLLG
jgi:membrane associated rhomboid family serine protease